jgi:hypothetical protein
MLLLFSVLALGFIAVLCATLYRKMGTDRMDGLVNKRRATSRLVSSGEFVDGNRHLKVALALTNSELHYENADMNLSLDLRSVHEIEYDTRLVTGHDVDGGTVLRLRSASQVFEFVVPPEAAPRWNAMLPPRGQGDSRGGTIFVPSTVSAP